jgi:hypothetical protein
MRQEPIGEGDDARVLLAVRGNIFLADAIVWDLLLPPREINKLFINEQLFISYQNALCTMHYALCTIAPPTTARSNKQLNNFRP